MEAMTYISGATGYVGLKLIDHLASRGRNLLLSARDEVKLHEVVKKISNTYPNQNFRGFACDLGNSESWEPAIELLKPFNVLEYINCSGIQGQLGPSSEVGYQELMNVFNVNLFSSMYFSNHFASSLREGEKSWGLKNFVLTPMMLEGIKQSGKKEKIIKFLFY